MKEIISVIIVIILLLIALPSINGEQPDIYRFKGDPDSPSILIIGGVHGDEPAGSVAAYKLIERYMHKPPKNTTTIIPNANKYGLRNNIRGMNFIRTDLNRQYPTEKNVHSSNNSVADMIINEVLKHDYSIDLHEGYDFHLRNPKSIGSTVYYTKKEDFSIANRSISNLNNVYRLDKDKKFSLLHPGDDKENSLSYYCYINGLNHILIETTGKKDIQPLQKRVDQHLILVESIVSMI